jgi:hypothetical protein
VTDSYVLDPATALPSLRIKGLGFYFAGGLVLIEANKSDESLGVTDPADQSLLIKPL